MKYLELRGKISQNIFTFLDVVKMFADEPESAIKTQLSRFAKKRLLTKIKRGLYCFDPETIEELKLAGVLYQPSYVSLETALNYYGIMPDIPSSVTSVATVTTKKIGTSFGVFSYTKIKVPLFFGFNKVKSPGSSGFFNLAGREKALLDYFYLRKIKATPGLRLSVKEFNLTVYQKYVRSFPAWVQAIKL